MPEQDLLDRFAEKARRLVDKAVDKVEGKFPEERYPVRPPYRRAVYRRFRKLRQALHDAWEALAKEEGIEITPAFEHGYARLEKQYMREYGLRTQKKEEKTLDT